MSDSFLYYNLTGGQTAEAKTICPKPCILRAVVINKTTAGAITVGDSSDTIATIPTLTAAGTYYRYDVDVKKSLVVTPAETGNITVVYKPSA